MKERILAVLMMIAILIFGLLVLWLVVGIFQSKKESYCNSLELAEYLENKECRRIIER